MYREHGVTLVEVLIVSAIVAVLAVVSTTILRLWSASGKTVPAIAQWVDVNSAIDRMMDEIGSSVQVLEAARDHVTVAVNLAASGAPVMYRDQLSGREVLLEQYTVRYTFRDAALYRQAWDRHQRSSGEEIVARVDGRFFYVDRSGNPTWDPSRVVMVQVRYGWGGDVGSAAAVVGPRPGFSVSLSKQIRTPLPPGQPGTLSGYRSCERVSTQQWCFYRTWTRKDIVGYETLGGDIRWWWPGESSVWLYGRRTGPITPSKPPFDLWTPGMVRLQARSIVPGNMWEWLGPDGRRWVWYYGGTSMVLVEMFAWYRY